MTMNGDNQSAAPAPLDLRTTHRDLSRTPDGLRVRGGSPRGAPGAHHTDTVRKRPAERCASKLPFRKRKIQVETDTQSQSPQHGEDCTAAPDASDLAPRERFPGPTGLTPVPVTLRRDAEHIGPGPGRYHIRYVHPFNYVPYQGLCLPPVLEPIHPLAHCPENLLTSITMATHQDEDGDTPLHIAVVQGELAIVCRLIQLLLCARRSLDIYNNLRQTPLHLAVITQQANMVEALLREGADPAALDRNGQTAMHLCCEYHQPDCLAVVLASPSSAPCLEIRNYEGLSPLHLAVLQGHKVLARMLLDAGADINAMDVKSGQSPLMHAVENNNTDMVHFLIERGCDVNTQSYSGNTALHNACGRGQVDTVRVLLKSGADSSLKNYHNDTPVMVAKNKKITDVLRGRGSNQIKVQDQQCVSASSCGSSITENGSPSPNHSRGCSPSTMPHALHHSSPKTPSSIPFAFY